MARSRHGGAGSPPCSVPPVDAVTSAPGIGTRECAGHPIAIIGAGPAGLVAAIALARRDVPTTVLERGPHPDLTPRFDPDRSYTIDITGHGLKALRHIDATDDFDARLLRFRGLQYGGRTIEEWTEPGWTGSRGDIVRALTAVTAEYKEQIDIEFDTRVDSVDVEAGAVTSVGPDGRARARQFDLVVGADGAGSVVRRAMQSQLAGFVVESKELPNYVTMIELDRLDDQMDKNYLQALATRPFCVAGAIAGDGDSEPPRWFCAIGTRTNLSFSSTEEARRYLRESCPRVLDLAGPAAIGAFARRTCFHIGKTLTCSQLHGGRTVLLGDAAGPFPPIGQGVNAAMESACVLDQCLERCAGRPGAAAAEYDQMWRPEVEAISWISEKMLFENRVHTLRANITMRLGINVIAQAKSSSRSYASVRSSARKFGALWR
jgi:kynurenine 3-monooxygenase